jgi:hypothetical protein
MDLITISLLVLGILMLVGWGAVAYAARPVPGVVVERVSPSPLISFIGIIGLILLVAFGVLLLTGWRFGLQITPP